MSGKVTPHPEMSKTMTDENENVEHEEQGGLADQVASRKKNLEAWREAGIDPYGQGYKLTHSASQIKKEWAELEAGEEGAEVSFAGRLVGRRDMGKAAFLDIADRDDSLQVYLRLNNLGEESYKRLAWVDLGDFLGIKGQVFRTKRGELSIKVSEWTMLISSAAAVKRQKSRSALKLWHRG